MTIKPWLSKNFLQMMQWSNVRDYPPKRKKPWLFDNFMEMEEIHSDHMEEPWTDPGGEPPLPPPPNIPQDPEDVEPDPCIGDRNLWVTVLPSSIDCDGSKGFTLTFSPDFQCIEISQAFFDEDGPKVVDGLGNTLEHPTNVENIIGGLKLEKGCDDPSLITLWASDCLCGGQSSVDIFLSNCGVDCGEVELSGPPGVLSNGVYQYHYTNFPPEAELQWSVIGTGAVIGQDGKLFTSGACGILTVIATSNCCGSRFMYVKVANSGVWLETQVLCDKGGGSDACNEYSNNNTRNLRQEWTCYSGTQNPAFYCAAYTPPSCYTGQCPESTSPYTRHVKQLDWGCPP